MMGGGGATSVVGGQQHTQTSYSNVLLTEATVLGQHNLALDSHWSHAALAIRAVRRLEMEKIMQKPDWEEHLKKYEIMRDKWVIFNKFHAEFFKLKKEYKHYSWDVTTPFLYKVPKEQHIFSWRAQ